MTANWQPFDKKELNFILVAHFRYEIGEKVTVVLGKVKFYWPTVDDRWLPLRTLDGDLDIPINAVSHYAEYEPPELPTELQT